MKQPIHNFLIDALNFEDYPKNPKTPREKIDYFFEIFDQEYGWNTERVGIQKSLAEWLSGLPNSICIPFYNHDILALADWEQSMKGLPPHPEKKHDRILNNYWNYLANHLIQLKNKKEPYLNKIEQRQKESLRFIENEFVNYIWKTHGPEGTWEIQGGLTRQDVINALKIYLERVKKGFYKAVPRVYLDSIDRENVRDIILENSKFTLSIEPYTASNYRGCR